MTFKNQIIKNVLFNKINYKKNLNIFNLITLSRYNEKRF